MRRRLAAVLLLVLLAGCTSAPHFTPNYDDKWGIEQNAEFHVGSDNFTAVVKPNTSNQTQIEAWQRTGLGKDEPVELLHPKIRYPNGTVSNLSTTEKNDRTVLNITHPNSEIAYMVATESSTFRHHMPVSGSTRVILPEGQRVSNPLLGRISPSGHNVTQPEPVEVTWSQIDKNRPIEVDYYGRNDPYMLGALVVVLLIAAAVVFMYYRKILERLQQKRKEVENRR